MQGFGYGARHMLGEHMGSVRRIDVDGGGREAASGGLTQRRLETSGDEKLVQARIEGVGNSHPFGTCREVAAGSVAGRRSIIGMSPGAHS